jgi:hypothetical protein
MPRSDNTNFPPVYQRLRSRMLRFGQIAFLCVIANSAIDLATRSFGVDLSVWKVAVSSVLLLGTLPLVFYIVRLCVLELRTNYAKSPLCPLCAAKMIASDLAAASSIGPSMPADAAVMFVCPRCSHGASRAELKAAWCDVT